MLKLPYAFGEPVAKGCIRALPEHFIVEEVPEAPPTGSGEHVYLVIQKRGSNTHWIAKQIAELANVRIRDVGYAGLKDRHAITSQVFTVYLSNRTEPDWQLLNSDDLSVQQISRTQCKIRRGSHRGNLFQITLSAVEGERLMLEQRLASIAQRGVPNYFGEQRFGFDGQNLVQAREALKTNQFPHDRHLRSLYLSAARSYLFNRLLGFRVERGDWDQALPGDILLGNERRQRSILASPLRPDHLAQVAQARLHPTGPLWGEGDIRVEAVPKTLELRLVELEPGLCRGLEALRMKSQRRPLRLMVKNLEWEWLDGDQLKLKFFLPTGSFATVVIRELIYTHHRSNRSIWGA